MVKKTKVVVVNPANPSKEALEPAAFAAREGQAVVFPTDTVYGVGTTALKPEAVLDIFRIKERPVSKPLILLIADPEDLSYYVSDVSPSASKLIKEYWPGPLTIIFKKSENVPYEITAGGDTVGIRCPDNLIARMLIRLAGIALATTSANLAGQPSPKNADEARKNLGGRVSYIIDGGQVKLGIESTVLDLSSDKPKLIREGYIPWSELKKRLGSLQGH
ncbi:MAG: L-threonylcarbamoyladenylate synthase [Actinomycetota bacterium]|nr:L-threonylcarbamoyladenylate synthase [Actinomycetota bacterium]